MTIVVWMVACLAFKVIIELNCTVLQGDERCTVLVVNLHTVDSALSLRCCSIVMELFALLIFVAFASSGKNDKRSRHKSQRSHFHTICATRPQHLFSPFVCRKLSAFFGCSEGIKARAVIFQKLHPRMNWSRVALITYFWQLVLAGKMRTQVSQCFRNTSPPSFDTFRQYSSPPPHIITVLLLSWLLSCRPWWLFTHNM